MLRNLLEGKPIYYGTNNNSKWVCQYRICRTISDGTIVKKHADFMEEFRHDPTGPHSFDPMRLQATLLLSEKIRDYESGGFYLELDNQRKYVHELGASKGDLILWRYNIPHGVGDVKVNECSKIGFMRIIYPSFQIGVS